MTIDDDAGPSHPQPSRPPRKNPSRSKSIRINSQYNRYVIKCTLGPFCKFQVVRGEIEEAVYWISLLQIHVHHIMTMYLVRNKGALHSTTNLFGMYNSMMRTFANEMSGKDKTTEYSDICHQYISSTNLERDWPEDVTSTWRGKLLDQMALSSATVHENHIEMNYTSFVLRYVKYLLRENEKYGCIRDLSSSKFKMVFSVISSILNVHMDKTVDEILDLREKTVEAIPKDSDVWNTVKELISMLRYTYIRPKMSLTQKSENMYTILETMTQYKKDLQERWLNNVPTPGIKKKQQWTFSLCPQLKWRPKHIHITSTSLKALLEKLARHHPKLKQVLDECTKKQEDVDDDDEWSKNFIVWDALFNLNRVMRRKHLTDPTTLRFANFISTDGVSVSCGFQKIKSDKELAIQHVSFTISGMKKDDSVDEKTLKDERTKLKNMKKEFEAWMKKRHSIESLPTDFQMTVDDDGIFECISGHTIVGLDPGVRSPATWIVHDSDSQRQHQQWKVQDGATHSNDETRYKGGTIYNGWLRFESGQKLFQRKMKRRMSLYCPDLLNTPTTKTSLMDDLITSYAFQCRHLPSIIAGYFGGDKWFQKQKMKQFVRKKRAVEHMVSRITGTNNKEDQSSVIVAHGDGDFAGTMRGVPPVMTKSLTKKLCQDTTTIFVNEFLTSQRCSCCLSKMTKEKRFRVKRCSNSDCIRTFWNRDTNAAINILNSFLYEVTHGHSHPSFTRTVVGA